MTWELNIYPGLKKVKDKTCNHAEGKSTVSSACIPNNLEGKILWTELPQLMTELFTFAVILLQDLTEGTLKALHCPFCEQVRDFHIQAYQDITFH